MSNDDIKSVIKKYTANKNSKYALMLNGSWGSGKTHFVKNEIFPILASINKKPIYVSLNGISHISQLEHALLILLYLKSDDKRNFIKSTGRILFNVINHIGLKKYEISLKGILDGANVDLLKLGDKVVFFDDLERCKLPIGEILGHINDYVEHKNLKAIILADETKISSLKSNPLEDGMVDDYSKIKEKVIGRSINFTFDISHTVSNIINSYKCDNSFFIDFLKEKEAFIIELIKEFEITNLRTIIFFLENLEELFITFRVDKDLYDQIIKASLMFCNEYKEGKLKPENYGYKNRYTEITIKDFYQKKLFREVIKSKDSSKKSDSDTDNEKLQSIRVANEETNALVTKYFKKDVATYVYFKSIHNFIYSGNLNRDLLAEEIKLIINNHPEPEEKILDDFLLTRYFHYTDKEFKRVHDKVLTYANEGKYDIYKYRQIYYYVKKLIEEKVSSLSKLELENILLTGLDIAKEKIKSTRDLDLHFPKVVNDDLISQKILTIHNEYYSNIMTKILEEMVTELRNGNLLSFETTIDQDDLFSFIKPKDLVEALTHLSNSQIYDFTEIITKRYGFDNIYKYHAPEYILLKEIVLSLNKIKVEIPQTMPVRTKLFEELINVLNATIKKNDEYV